MNKTIITFSILFVFTLSAYSQNKRDYIWTFGLDGVEDPGIQGYRLDFNIIPFEPVALNHPFRINHNNASICDEAGKLLFYTNGCFISNAENGLMSNDIPINNGPYLQELGGGLDCTVGYIGTQNIIILTDPANEMEYYILHKPRGFDQSQDPATFLNEIRFTKIDMTLNNGLGDVTVKDSTIYFGDRLLSSYFTSINHSNGKDWWIIQPVEETNRYKRFLIDSAGITEMTDQEIGPEFHWNASAAGTARFSPDGTKYAYYNFLDGLILFDFDRETGLLSNDRQVIVHDTTSSAIIFSSMEWSANSRFIYSANKTKLYQIDTHEDNLEDGIELIDIYDGTENPFPNTFFLMALAPDCKIYMCSTSGNRTYHVINKPDEKGIACEFHQNGLTLPINAGFGTMPNFPRWRVDEEEKCDPSIVSMFGELVYYRHDLSVYPNPTTGPLTIDLPQDRLSGTLAVVDHHGQQIASHQIESFFTEYTLDLSRYPSGIYYIEYLPRDNKERKIYTGKVVLTHP